jgi:hypothetical protein
MIPQEFIDFILVFFHEWNFDVLELLKYFKFATFSLDLIPLYMLWYCPAFFSGDLTIFSAFISRAISLLVTNKPSCFSL